MGKVRIDLLKASVSICTLQSTLILTYMLSILWSNENIIAILVRKVLMITFILVLTRRSLHDDSESKSLLSESSLSPQTHLDKKILTISILFAFNEFVSRVNKNVNFIINCNL